MTGASRGLGYGCAAALARRGDNVVIASRTERSITSAARELDELGSGAVIGVTADINDPETPSRLVRKAVDIQGRLDVVIANTGGQPFGSVTEIGDDELCSAFSSVVLAPLRLIREGVALMREQGYGRIVVIGSSTVRMPSSDLALSNMMRPALVGYVKSLATEVAVEGVTVNLAAPGRVDTSRVQKRDVATASRQGISVEEVRAASAAAIPAGRYGRIEEFGALVAFLTSETASFVTGQTILADGGMVPTLP